MQTLNTRQNANTIMDRTATFYSAPSYQFRGAGFPVYAGSRRQRGGSVLGALKQMVTPVVSSVGNTVKKAALNQAFGLATDVVGDMIRGRNIQQSLREHGVKRLKNVGKESLNAVIGRVSPIKRVSRKRPAKGKKHPPKKRRRIGLF